MKKSITLYIGSDHGGFELKSVLATYLVKAGNDVHDMGALQKKKDDDYPEYAFAVAEEVVAHPGSFGILICRSGGGMTIAANKVIGARAVECWSVESVKHARRDNDANILIVPSTWVDQMLAKKIVDTFISTKKSLAARHARRISQIAIYERS